MLYAEMMMPKRHEQSRRANSSNPLAFMVVDVWVEERRGGGGMFCRPRWLGTR